MKVKIPPVTIVSNMTHIGLTLIRRRITKTAINTPTPACGVWEMVRADNIKTVVSNPNDLYLKLFPFNINVIGKGSRIAMVPATILGLTPCAGFGTPLPGKDMIVCSWLVTGKGCDNVPTVQSVVKILITVIISPTKVIKNTICIALGIIFVISTNK